MKLLVGFIYAVRFLFNSYSANQWLKTIPKEWGGNGQITVGDWSKRLEKQ